MYNGTAYVENTLALPLILKHRINVWSNNFTSGYIPRKFERKDPNGYFYKGFVAVLVIHPDLDVISVKEKPCALG